MVPCRYTFSTLNIRIHQVFRPPCMHDHISFTKVRKIYIFSLYLVNSIQFFLEMLHTSVLWHILCINGRNILLGPFCELSIYTNVLGF